MKLFALEGNTQRLDGGAMFGNAPKALWQRWVTADEQNRIPLSCRSLLIQTDSGRNVLFETGVGAFFDPKLKERYGVVEDEHMLLKHLNELGIKEEDIDDVVLSHLHFDHAGGILSAYKENEDPTLLFPNATFYVGKKHWDRAQAPQPRERASFITFIQQRLNESGRIVLLEEGDSPDLGFKTSLFFSEGHTVGLMISIIELEAGPMAFVSDLAPGLPWLHIPITMGYDRFPELLLDEKKTLFEDLLQKQGMVFFTHDTETACAVIKKNEKGKFYGEPLPLENLSTQVNSKT